MAVETIIANMVGAFVGVGIKKAFSARLEAKMRAMPYAEKRKYVEASQQAYIDRQNYRSWRYRLGLRVGRYLRK